MCELGKPGVRWYGIHFGLCFAHPAATPEAVNACIVCQLWEELGAEKWLMTGGLNKRNSMSASLIQDQL